MPSIVQTMNLLDGADLFSFLAQDKSIESSKMAFLAALKKAFTTNNVPYIFEQSGSSLGLLLWPPFSFPVTF